MMPIHSANIIIKNAQGRVLLQMRDGTSGIRHPLKWGLWGGAIEDYDADCFAAAAREMTEELGITAQPEHFSLLHKREREDGALGHYMLYHAPLEWGQFQVLEGAGAAFFTINEIRQLQTSNNIQWILSNKPEILA